MSEGVRYSREIHSVLVISETDERTTHCALYDAIAALEKGRCRIVNGNLNSNGRN